MNQLFQFSLALILCLQTNIVFATTTPKNFPTDLIYKNRPIDSLCFYEPESTEGFISLAHCGLESEPNREITNVNQQFAEQGYIGYNYIWTMDEIESHGISYYKVLGKINSDYIIYAINKSGGTGDFTSLQRIKRDGNRIHFNIIAGGDRCNSGINSAEIKNNKLTYFTNVTSADLFTLTNQHIRYSKILSNMLDCAACCVAVAKHEINLNENSLTSKLILLDLTSYKNQPIIKSENSYQYCFDKLLKKYLSKKIRFLNKKEVEAFVNEFNDQCTK